MDGIDLVYDEEFVSADGTEVTRYKAISRWTDDLKAYVDMEENVSTDLFRFVVRQKDSGKVLGTFPTEVEAKKLACQC